MNNSTSLVREAGCNIRQNADSRAITLRTAAQEKAVRVDAIRRCYDFDKDAEHCFYRPDGLCVQAAMKLTRKAIPDEIRRVFCKFDQGAPDGTDLIWFVTNMAGAEFEAADYIEAVRQHVDENRRLREGGR